MKGDEGFLGRLIHMNESHRPLVSQSQAARRRSDRIMKHLQLPHHRLDYTTTTPSIHRLHFEGWYFPRPAVSS